MITDYCAKFIPMGKNVHVLAEVDRLSQSLIDATVDLIPHQLNTALLVLKNSLNKGVTLANEFG